ncbi:MAG: helix-turn-helix domain-containing protein [Cyanobacteriota bacterium]|nr:helix-turn-helix domain-containing protein [Cyanobacteriota bacterium]
MTRQAPKKEKQNCPAEKTLAAIAGRWKLLILRELCTEQRRFGELQRALSGVTQKVLTQQLRELEADGIVHREIYPQVPPKVEYSLTELGISLQPIIQKMHDWGQENRDER